MSLRSPTNRTSHLWKHGRSCPVWVRRWSPRLHTRCTSEYGARSGAHISRDARPQPTARPLGSRPHACRTHRKRHYKGKTKKIGVVVAVLAGALGLAGVFGVLHSVLTAEDIGAAIWAATCVLWAGFLAVMARQLGWEDPNSSSSSSAHRRRRCARDAACYIGSRAALLSEWFVLSYPVPGTERVGPHTAHSGAARPRAHDRRIKSSQRLSRSKPPRNIWESSSCATYHPAVGLRRSCGRI